MKVAVVVPSYRVRERIGAVLCAIGPEVAKVYVVDDACPEKTGDFVEGSNRDTRVSVFRNAENLGVGGAVKAGIRLALTEGAEVIVKLDGDGQMDPALIPALIRPILEGRADYVKGNRFFELDGLAAMPRLRLFGNALLSLVNKAASGYWDVMDPTNGFVAIHADVARRLPLDKIADDYFFESDLLFRLGTLRAVVLDMPMAARYDGAPSSMSIGSVALRFPGRYLGRFVKRVFYSYFLRDFNAGTVQILSAAALLGFGTAFGLWRWYLSVHTGIPATSGTVMVAALPVLIGGHLLISAINYDIANVPRRPLHPLLGSGASKGPLCED
jgi:glycosyltransferase involved in cell wall biosynthesis